MTAINEQTVEEKKSEEVNIFEQFGKFQFLQYVWICLTLFMISMTHVNYVFVAENIDYR